MSRYWKAALPFLLAAVIILAAASRPVVLHIGFPCDSYWNVPGENYYTFIDAAIEKFEAEHPNVKVEYTSGIRVEDYTEWLSGQYLLGQEPDVMVPSRGPCNFQRYSFPAGAGSVHEARPGSGSERLLPGGIAGRSRQGETVCAAAGMRAADDVHQ